MVDRLKRWFRSLRDLSKDTWGFSRDAQLPLVASSLAYTTILSIIPLLAVSFSIFKAFGGIEKLYALVEPVIFDNLAEGVSDEAITKIRGFIGNIHAGAIGVTGFVGLVVTSMSMLSSIEKAINRVWRATIQRTLFQRISTYWLIITFGPLALAISLGAATTSSLPLSKFVPSGTGSYLIAVCIFTAVYKLVPNRKVNWWPSLISAFVMAGVWNLVRAGYALYTKKAISYSTIYGSLGAVPILLLWIYIVWLVVLSGAALTAAIQKRFD